MNRMKKRKFTMYLIVNSKSELALDGLLSLNAEYAKIENHLSRLREIYLSKPEEFPHLRKKLLNAEHRRRQLEEILTGYFDLIVVLPEE